MSEPAKVAVVTGGSSGIGNAICKALAQGGYIVIAVGKSPERLKQAVSTLKLCSGNDTREQHAGICADVTSEADMQRVFSDCVAQHGRIDLLVASAGIGRKPGSQRVMPYPADQLPLDEWNAVLDVNLTGIFLSNREATRHMTSAGHGHIINICSSTTPSGLHGTAYAPAYCASKFGVVGLTESLASEVQAQGIQVQAVFPGPVTTPLVDETLLARPFGGSMPAEHFAQAVVELARNPGEATIVHPHMLPVRQSGQANP